MNAEKILEAENVAKSFGDFRAVNGVSFNIFKGECFGLLGPNGAGKSTLISLIYGAASRTEGSLSVFGKDPQTHAREIKKRLGVVTQNNSLDEAMSVIENMLVYASFVQIPPADRASRVMELLDFMALAHKKDSGIKELSGGMKRRLVFVRALLSKPDLVILDEPTTGLDPAVRHLLWDKVKELKSLGTSVLLTTHYMDEAERLCDRLVIMDQGKIAACGSPRELIRDNIPGFIAHFPAGEHDLELVADLATAHEDLEVIQDSSGLSLRAPKLERLTELSEKHQLRPSIIRPTNLEDVFLKITGKELSAHA